MVSGICQHCLPREETTTADWVGIDFSKQEDKSTIRMYCPICGHTLNFQISRDATLRDLERMQQQLFSEK